MDSKIELAFRPDALMVPVDKILPVRKLPANIQVMEKYKRILASLREVGLIEPLILYPQRAAGGCYMLLDGAIRLDALKSLGKTEVLCLVATEEETYTYNQKINQMTPIQEHFMIIKALRSGVPEARIAATLNIDVSRVRQKQNLLAGICPEAVAMIKDKRISAATLRELKRVAPLRQLEMIDLMTTANDFTLSYAKCLYVGTSEDQKLEGERPKNADHGLPAEESARMRGELVNLTREYKTIQETHGENVLHLVPITGYLKTLMANPRVLRLLGQRFPDILIGFQRMVQMPELDAA